MEESPWLRLIWGVLDEETEEQLVRDGVVELNRILIERPDVPEGVERILETRTSLPLSEGTFDDVRDALVNYLDSESASLFLWTAWDTAERLRRISEYGHLEGAEQAASLLRRVASRFGKTLWLLDQAAGGLWDDWNYIYTSAVYDQENNVYRLRIDITKNNGERARIEGGPDSMMDLTRHAVRMLVSVGSRESYGDAVRQPFLEAVDDIVALLRAPTEDEWREIEK
jgi:hypothetical protein